MAVGATREDSGWACHKETLVARVLLYTTVPIIAKGFTVVLSAVPDFDLVGVCTSIGQLPQTVAVTAPNLLVVDVDEQVSYEGLLELRRAMPAGCKVVLWVQSITPELAYQMMRLGVRGILRRTLGSDVMLKCLQKVCEGECWFEETLTASFLNIRTVRLTRRESQLISLISQGHKNKEIADALFIAEPTVKIYLSRLFRKVGAKDRFELALYGLRNMITGQINLLAGGGQHQDAAASAPRPPVLLVEDKALPGGQRPVAVAGGA